MLNKKYYICGKKMAYNKTLIRIDGRKLATARKKAGITQVELSALTGLHQEYLSYLETGKVKSIHKRTKDKINIIIKF
jgi:transcriptional regulator with XRE-family HTH domain